MFMRMNENNTGAASSIETVMVEKTLLPRYRAVMEYLEPLVGKGAPVAQLLEHFKGTIRMGELRILESIGYINRGITLEIDEEHAVLTADGRAALERDRIIEKDVSQEKAHLHHKEKVEQNSNRYGNIIATLAFIIAAPPFIEWFAAKVIPRFTKMVGSLRK